MAAFGQKIKKVALGIAVAVGLTIPAQAGPMSSTGFQNDWNVIDAGGNTRASATFKLYDAIFQSGIGFANSASFSGHAGFVQALDTPTATPSPTQTPTATETPTPSPLLIVEFVSDPTGAEPGGEYVVVRNNTAASYDISSHLVGDDATLGGGEGTYQFPAFSSPRGGALWWRWTGRSSWPCTAACPTLRWWTLRRRPT